MNRRATQPQPKVIGEALSRYHSFLIEDMQRQAKDIWKPKEGYVYFLRSEAGPIKIGFAVDVPKRVKALRNMSPVNLTVAAVVRAPISIETAYHRQFAGHRLHGEWFSPHPEILAEIALLKTNEVGS